MPAVKLEEIRRFMVESLMIVGAPAEEAQAHADLLLHADVTGHYSHGLNRLVFYVDDILKGATNPNAKPTVLKEHAATAWVDGADALGSTIGNYCMDLAIQKAKEFGVGWVSAKRCNHFGMAGYWTRKAEREGLIGLAFTNSSPVLVPTRAKTGALGTSPIGMSAPAANGDSLIVDLATTAVALGKIEMQIHKQEPLPAGWAMGPDGEVTTDAQLAFKTGRLLPLGGLEETSGYKGYALSSMVETFCSGLSGSKPSHRVRMWSNAPEASAPPDLGQCFAAIDPDRFAPGFGERLAECLTQYRAMEPVDPSLPVLAPGDKEKNNAEETNKRGAVVYPEKQIESCNALAIRLNVNPLQVL